jgi:dihydroneopterin aldolase
MTQPPIASGAVRLTSARVFVRDLVIEAEIGVHAHEHGRRQPLVIEVELQIRPGPFAHITDTINYETVAERAREIAAAGHLKLVEAFAERLAHALLGDVRVLAVRVRVDKPQALAPAIAGVEVSASRT